MSYGRADLASRNESVLVLVDYQVRLLPAIHDGENVLAQALLLADIATILAVPIVGTEQNSRGLGPSDSRVGQRVGVMHPKMHFDACADGLVSVLNSDTGSPSNRDIVLAGCEAHVCLLQTALGLLNAGFKVWVVAPACGSRDPENKQLAMARLREAGATIVSVEMVAFEWLRSCEHERFRQVLSLLKASDAGE